MAFILVTGGRGFIGSNLVRRLVAEGNDVRVLDNLAYPAGDKTRPEVEFLEGSVADASVLKAAFAGIDRCVHLAGTPAMRDPRSMAATPAGTFTAFVEPLFKAALDAGAAVVYASSAAVYGEAAESPIREDASVHPVTAHGMEKLALEATARQFADRFRLPSVGLRMFNVFGAGQSPASPYCGVVRKFADKALAGEPVTLFGDGRQVRDFIYVDDATDCILRAATAPLTGADVVNVCSGVPVTILDVVAALEKNLGFRLRIRHEAEAAATVRLSLGDPSKGRSKFGFKAPRPFGEGVALMISELRGHTS